MPTIHSIGRLICERKGVESVFDSYSFQQGMTFIGHWEGFRIMESQVDGHIVYFRRHFR